MTCLLVAYTLLVAFAPGSEAGGTSVRLPVEPMPEPTPAFQYRLLPALSELKPGNPAQGYLKCFMEQRSFFFSKQAAADRERYQTMPLAELPSDLSISRASALRQADWAARLGPVDWQALQQAQGGGIEVLPAELGPLQILTQSLNVRFRAEVAQKHFTAALRTAQTMFTLARHLGEYPAKPANLVGLWAAHLALGTLTEMVQQPGCPNLYWALTDLPSPLVDLRKGVQGDSVRVAAELRLIRDDARMTESEIEAAVSRLFGLIGFAHEQDGRAPHNLRARLSARVNDPERVGAARRHLVEAGAADGLVPSLPDVQVVLLDETRRYAILRDERLKLLALPLAQHASWIGREASSREGDALFGELLPPIARLCRAQGELEREIALLRHVEALRLHAAACGGGLPAELSEIPVPLPSDPLTGRPFEYRAEGTTAHLRSGPGVHYEVILRK